MLALLSKGREKVQPGGASFSPNRTREGFVIVRSPTLAFCAIIAIFGVLPAAHAERPGDPDHECTYTPGPASAARECTHPDTPPPPPPAPPEPIGSEQAFDSDDVLDREPPAGFDHGQWRDMLRWGYTEESWFEITQTAWIVTPILKDNLTGEAVRALVNLRYDLNKWRVEWLPSFVHNYYNEKEQIYDGPEDVGYMELEYKGVTPELPWNATFEALKWAPVFDYDTNSCLPTVAFGIEGNKNGGLKNTGSPTGKCRKDWHLSNSNLYHRDACQRENGKLYCAHMYMLYFEKDQVISGSGGHKHDIESAIIWLTDGELTHISYSDHIGLGWAMRTRPKASFHYADLAQRQAKLVYHLYGRASHDIRRAGRDEEPETKAINGARMWHRPTLVSWTKMEVEDGITNEELRRLFNTPVFGAAAVSVSDKEFRDNIHSDRWRPKGYPKIKVCDQTFCN